MFEIEIFTKEGFKDSRGEHVLSDILGIGIEGVAKVNYASLYIIDGAVTQDEAQAIASELLSDKITESYTIDSKSPHCGTFNSFVIEVFYKKGVTDTVAESVVKAVKDLGIVEEVKVRTGHKYYIYGNVSHDVLDKIAVKLLANTLVQEYKIK
ncbi:MAG: phosphoribosylformylglycinamidine synthase subunit PurS [Endomicrobium sp.]|jgi:phosphoribosylformylglycinamidine synthase|nr:phosphoribosylformylglycinamidine synthase subunit PurS [Endomicrobium sp.]